MYFIRDLILLKSKKRSTFYLVSILVSILLSSNYLYASPLVNEKYDFQISKNNENTFFDGVTLYSITGKEKVLLLDIDGKIINEWDVDAVRPRLLPNCNLLALHGTDWGKKTEPWKSLRRTISEYNWDGEKVWEYTSKKIVHHDVNRFENGNTLFPVKTTIKKKVINESGEEAPELRRIRSDIIIEVDKEKNEVWSWALHDYLDITSCGARDCNFPLYHERWIKVRKDWSHVNTTSVLPDNKWFEAGNEIFRPGNIIFLARNLSQVFIIDKGSKQIVWEYSGDYKGGLMFPHESYMIPEGYPGAGNILIFDNGGKKRPITIILEVNPITKKVVWKYEPGPKFYISAKGAAQRLPNGNTLISTGPRGDIIEVSPNGKTVWKLESEHAVNRAKRYSHDFCNWNEIA